MPNANPFGWIQERLDAIEQAGLRRDLTPTERGEGLRIERGATSLVNFGSNDYLGLASREPPVVEAARGSGASPLVSGYHTMQAELEEELAAFEGTEASLVFPSGFAANLAVLATLPEEGDLILSDALNHASIVDGCRLSRAERFIYRHADHALVGNLLRHHRSAFRRVWIVTDGVFSMDGTLAPLPELVAVADDYDATLIVDEAHGTGVLGHEGRGACEACGVEDQVLLRIGTLSKAIGSLGGFVAAPQLVIDYLINRARTLIYSTALPPTVIAAARAGLQQIENEPERRERLKAYQHIVQERLAMAGSRVPSIVTPIVPILLGDNQSVLAAQHQLAEAGFFVPAIRAPTVPAGTARLRITLSAGHAEEDVIRLADCLVEILRS